MDFFYCIKVWRLGSLRYTDTSCWWHTVSYIHRSPTFTRSTSNTRSSSRSRSHPYRPHFRSHAHATHAYADEEERAFMSCLLPFSFKLEPIFGPLPLRFRPLFHLAPSSIFQSLNVVFFSHSSYAFVEFRESRDADVAYRAMYAFC